MDIWHLPMQATIGGRTYPLHAAYRDILEIFSYLNDPEKPDCIKWEVALALFYAGEIPEQHRMEAVEYFKNFICCGQPEDKPGPRLLDWQHDAGAIISDINRTAGQEVRALPFVHWWTFLSWFHGIGEGQLSTLVSIRDKLARGKKLEKWEKDFYRENKARVDLPKRYTAEERAQQQRLKALLGE